MARQHSKEVEKLIIDLRDDGKMPPIPEAVSPFSGLAPSHWRVLARKAQGFSDKEIAKDLGIKQKTVSAYADRARDRLGFDTVPETVRAVYRIYAPGLWASGD